MRQPDLTSSSARLVLAVPGQWWYRQPCQWFAIVALIVGCATRAGLAYPPEIEEIFANSDLNRCGPFSLQVCAHFLAPPVHQQDIEKYLPTDGHVTTFGELANAAHHLGFTTAAIRWSNEPLVLRVAPAILAVQREGQPHFITVLGRRGDQLLVVDFPKKGWISYQHLRNKMQWKGEALHIARSNWGIIRLYALLYWRQVGLGLVAALVGLIIFRRRRWLVGTTHSARLPVQSALALMCAASFVGAVGCSGNPDSPHQRIARIEPAERTIEASDAANEQHEAETVLKVVNVCDIAVTVNRVVTSCGCTHLGTVSPSVIEPSETATIPLRVELPDIGVKLVKVAVVVQAGSIRQTLLANLQLRGRPIEAPAIVRIPEEVVLHRDSSGYAEAMVQVHTYEKSGTSPWIEYASADSPSVTIQESGMEESKTPEPGVSARIYSYSITTTQASEKYKADVSSTVRISLHSSVIDPSAQFFVRLEDWLPVRFIPASIFLSRIDRPYESIERRLRIVFTDPRFRPTKVDTTSDDHWLQVTSVTFDEVGNAGEALVTLELQPEKIPESGSVRTDLEVSVYGEDDQLFEATVPVLVKRDNTNTFDDVNR